MVGWNLGKERVGHEVLAVSGREFVLHDEPQIDVNHLAERFVLPCDARLEVVTDSVPIRILAGSAARPAVTVRDTLHEREEALDFRTQVYPLPPHVPKYERPEPPPHQAWNGDRLALLGSSLPTSVLMSLAGRGWTFEAVCCAVAVGDDRVVVKKTIRRLEAEGVLEGSRPRGPGFGPRLLRIADAFPAREELQALIDAVPVAWADLGDRLERAFDHIPEKTKVYFRRRWLWTD